MGRGAPWFLTVVFVLVEGELPTLSEDLAATPVGTEQGTVAQLAQRIADSTSGSSELPALWQALAEAIIEEALADDDVRKPVSDAVAEVLQESEFSYFRYRRSADLDIDDLSDSEDLPGSTA